MTRQPPANQRTPRPRAKAQRASSGAAGPSVGPVRLTPLRVTLAIALAGGLGFLGWSVFVRDANQAYQVPMMATGFAVCGVVLAIVAFLSIGRIVRAGREGRDGTAVLTALAGGIVAVVAMLMLAGAVIMSMIWTETKGG